MENQLAQRSLFSWDFNQYYIRPECVPAILEPLRSHDFDTYDHSIRVAETGRKLALYLDDNVDRIYSAFALHDIGKLNIPSAILKKRPWTDAEVKIVRSHPAHSKELLKDLDLITAEVALRHHTHQNGDSYPANLPPAPSQLIEKYSLVLAVVDSFDSMTTRNYNSNIGSCTKSPAQTNENTEKKAADNPTYPFKPEAAKNELIRKFSTNDHLFQQFFRRSADEFIEDIYRMVLTGTVIPPQRNIYLAPSEQRYVIH